MKAKWSIPNLSQSTVQTFSQIANLNLTNDPDRGFNYYPSEDWNFQDLPAEMRPRPNANYTVGKYVWFNIVHYPSINVFNGSVLYYPVDQTPSSDYMEGIWDASADLDGWIHNLASSMSNVIAHTTSLPMTSIKVRAISLESKSTGHG